MSCRCKEEEVIAFSWAAVAAATRAHTHTTVFLSLLFFLGADFFPPLFFPWPFRSSGGRKGAKLPLPPLKAHMNTGRFLGRRRRRYKKIKGFLFLLLFRIIGGKEKEEEEHLLCQMKETPISKGGGGGQRENPLSTVYPPFFSGERNSSIFLAARGFAFPFVWALIHWKKGGEEEGGM